jgi:hypothetical protein
MDVSAHFRDISAELRAVQNRIRRLIGNIHWPTDGAWKESVIRSVLRGYLPSSYSVGSGFVLTPDGPSTQIDILIYDDSAPVHFRDGDFVIIPADCVRAAIEVKTSLAKAPLGEALEKLNAVASLLRKRSLTRRPFIGLFCFEPTTVDAGDILELLQQKNGETSVYEISALSFGDSQFYRFWEFDPNRRPSPMYETWHAYDVPELSQGYFLHNVIEHLFPRAFERAQDLWYPAESKELRLIARVPRRRPAIAAEK